MPITEVETRKGDGWALITLSSPAGLNKLGSDTLVPLLEEIRSNLAEDPRCLAIVGKGESFAVGADLREISELTPVSAREFSNLGNSIFRLLENTGSMVIAGIDGFCLGGGVDLALAADWRIASNRSVFGHPGTDLGLITGFGGTQRLPRLIGSKRAANWFYSAARICAPDAYEAGFIQEITSEHDFNDTLTARIRAFAALPPEWVRSVKEKFRYYADGGEKWLGKGGGYAPVE